eukprot:4833148-Alexandrium_andersonii.AAC.1
MTEDRRETRGRPLFQVHRHPGRGATVEEACWAKRLAHPPGGFGRMAVATHAVHPEALVGFE